MQKNWKGKIRTVWSPSHILGRNKEAKRIASGKECNFEDVGIITRNMDVYTDVRQSKMQIKEAFKNESENTFRGRMADKPNSLFQKFARGKITVPDLKFLLVAV